jgi:N-acetylneuraminate synthase
VTPTNSLRSPIFVIAEAGVNHNGSPTLAHALVDAAFEAGADAVKFQTFVADRLVTDDAPLAAYQAKRLDSTRSQHEMIEQLELSPDTHRELATHCRRLGIEFMSTPFDIESLHFLVENIGVQRLKIGSGDATNAPLLLAAARSGLPIIVSTGMCDLAEVEAALQVIAYGLVAPEGQTPTGEALSETYQTEEAKKAIREFVTLLHCTSEYPAPPKDVNLRAMSLLRDTFEVSIGYSDHTVGTTVPIAAAALGASVVEKHFTIDRSMAGPDHASSLEPDELVAMVRAIRETEIALGERVKKRAASETKNAEIARRSLVAEVPIAAGERFTESNVAIKRPGTGLSPMRFWEILGSTARRDYRKGELLDS